MIWLQTILMCYAMDDQMDTPIQKITIKPAPPTSAVPVQHLTNADSSNVNRYRGRKIEINSSPPTIIKVLKKPLKKLNTSGHSKKFAIPSGNSTAENKIYFTRARVNGSFRQSVGKTRDAKELWHTFRIKPIPLSN